MDTVAFRMHFLGPLHVDAKGTGFYSEAESFIRSDTLSGALTQAACEVGFAGAVDWAKNPPWRVSSAFPCYGRHLFLPRPVFDRAVVLRDEQLDQAKRIKKICWLDAPLWTKVVAGEWDWAAEEAWRDLPGGLAVQRDPAESPSEGLRVCAEEERPRLAISRASNTHAEGRLFGFSRIHYPDEGGLWFVAQVDNDLALKDLRAALDWLGDQGIGADRTSGNGHFQVQTVYPIPIRLASPGEAGVALSLVNPAEGELDAGLLASATYDLIRRGGWIGATGRRKAGLRMFAEGSRFKPVLQGRVVKVADHPAGHPVFRDGRGVFAAIGREG